MLFTQTCLFQYCYHGIPRIIILSLQWLQYDLMLNLGKGLLCHMWTVKVQISMCICAVWSGHSLFVDIYFNIHWFFKRATKAVISLRKCAGWSGPLLPVNVQAHQGLCCPQMRRTIRAYIVCKLHKGAYYVSCTILLCFSAVHVKFCFLVFR